jgi:hypothetical protein
MHEKGRPGYDMFAASVACGGRRNGMLLELWTVLHYCPVGQWALQVGYERGSSEHTTIPLQAAWLDNRPVRRMRWANESPLRDSLAIREDNCRTE